MAMPSQAITRFDLSFSYSEFALMAERMKFVGLRVLPPAAVALQTAEFLRINVESYLNKVEDTKRAPKAGYKRDDFEWDKDSYATEDHGVEEVMDDRTVRMYGDIVRAEMIHTERAVHRVLQALESDIASAVFNTTTWTGAALTTAVGTPWTTKATADPIANIDAAKDKVEENSGQIPNTLVASWKAIRAMARTDRVEDLLKYSGRDDPKRFVAALEDLLEIDIVVANGNKNTADRGQSAAYGKFWNETMAMVCHVDDGDDIESLRPQIGRTFMWNEENAAIPGADTDGETSLIVEEYREENVRGGVLRARNDRQVKVFHPEAGHLLTAVTA